MDEMSMMATVLLFIGYCFFFALLIKQLSFFKNTGLSCKVLWGLFALKILFGLSFHYIHAEVLVGTDSLSRFEDGKALLQAFPDHPWSVLKALVLPFSMWDSFELQPYITQFSYPNGNLSEYVLIRVYAIFQFIGGGSFYSVIPFMAFFVLIANLKLYQLFSKAFLDAPKQLLLLLICCFPSVAFFTGGLYKDGLIYIGLCLMISHFWQFINEEKKFTHLIWIASGMFIMGLFRWADLVIYGGVLFVFFMVRKYNEKVLIRYLSIFASIILLIVIMDLAVPQYDLMTFLDQRKGVTQYDFSNSVFYFPDWKGNPLLLVACIPLAIVNGLFRPFPWDADSLIQLIGGIETVVLFLGLLVCIIFRKEQRKFTPLSGFLMFASLARLAFVGLFIENSGTVIRHRSEILIFLIVFFITYFLDTNKLKSFFLKPTQNIDEKPLVLRHLFNSSRKL